MSTVATAIAAKHLAVTVIHDVQVLPARIGYTARQLRHIGSRVSRLEKVTAGLGAAALVATALKRLGLGWLRCAKVTRTGKAICGMDGNLLESLLIDAAAVTVAFDIVAFAKELQGITGEAAHLIRDFAE